MSKLNSRIAFWDISKRIGKETHPNCLDGTREGKMGSAGCENA